MMSEFDRCFMSMALREAEKAAADGEVPTGCVIVEPAPLEGGREGEFDSDPCTARILARAHNQPEMLQDALFIGKGQVTAGVGRPALVLLGDVAENARLQRPALVRHATVQKLAGHGVVQAAVAGICLVQFADDVQILRNAGDLFFHKKHLAE